MTQRETPDDRTGMASMLNMMPADMAAMNRDRLEDFINAQTKLFESLQESNKQWFQRVQSEVNLATEFASRISSARSIPDAMNVYQECCTRRIEAIAEDGRHLFSDAQKFMEAGARMLSNGPWSQGRTGGFGT